MAPPNPTLPYAYSIKTKRLVIRFYQPKDFPIWRETYLTLTKPQNRWDQKLRGTEMLTRNKFNKIIQSGRARRKRGEFFDFVAFERKSGKIIGHASLMEILRGVFHNAYLGYGVFNSHWGKGYATEIVDAVIEIGFRDLKLHRIEAGIEPQNRRSIALAKKLKMRREGYSKRRLHLGGRWVDIICYALTSEERGYKHPGGQLMGNRR